MTKKRSKKTQRKYEARKKDANFGFDVPVAVAGVDSAILDPRSTWADGEEYDRTAQRKGRLIF